MLAATPVQVDLVLQGVAKARSLKQGATVPDNHTFEPPLQTLFAFCRTDAFRAKAASLDGYRVDGLGTVRFNGLAP